MDTPKSRAYIEKVNSGGFSIRHTSGENLPSSPLLSPQQRARKHASVSPEKPLAGERPRLQRLPASPKLERRKALKFDELLLEEESAWVALLNTTSPADATLVAGSLVRIFATEGRDNSIVKYCIMMEVAAAGAHTVPFRSPGIYSAVVLQSCLHHARIYLHDVLGPVLTDLVHKSNLGFEIDPRYVGTEEVARNLQNLTHVANHLLAAMLISVDLLPIPLRRIYRFAQRCIEGTYPAAAALIPGRLFFTHLVCEALLRPEEHGLAKGKLSDAVMRAHILLAKMLRCVGEETGPSEECMLPLVQWMNKAVTSARRFFKLALNVVATDTLDNHPGLLKLHSLPNPLAKQDRAFLTKFVCDNQVRFRWELVSLQAESALHALRSIVPEKVSASVMRKVPIPVAEGEGSSTVSSS